MLHLHFLLLCFQCISLIRDTHGHGYLADPPARSSAWLFDKDFKSCCQHFNHNEMFCGGAYRQWTLNGGKCSICGEPHDSTSYSFGLGGAMYLGKIVRTYQQGSIIPVTVVLTANHMGGFEFRVCNIDQEPKQDATQSCLDLNLLNVATGLTRYPIDRTYSTVHLNVTLPANLTCQHCVFQWKYITGNSWGTHNGKSCLGCGRENEEFYGCSDIAIVNEVESIVDATTATVTSDTPGISTEASRRCTPVVTFSSTLNLTPVMEQYCESVCETNCAAEKRSKQILLYNECLDSCEKLCLCQ